MRKNSKFRILRQVLIKTGAAKILLGFIFCFFVAAFILWLIEPEFTSYGKSLWYCYSVFSTVGFGDIVAQTFLGRVISVIITISSLLVIGLITGIIVAFYTDVVTMRYKLTKAEVLDQMENLQDLTQEELKDLSNKIKKIEQQTKGR